jgi:hypothetical protein
MARRQVAGVGEKREMEIPIEIQSRSKRWILGGCANKLTPWYELIGRLTP